MDLQLSHGVGSTFLTGGRTAKRLISDLVPGEVLKSLLKPMPPRPHARVTMETWVDRQIRFAPRDVAALPPQSQLTAQTPTNSPPFPQADIEPEPIIDSGLLVDEPAFAPAASRIAALAHDEPKSKFGSEPFRTNPRGAKIVSLDL